MDRNRCIHEIAKEALADPALKGNARTYSEAYLVPMTTMCYVTDVYGLDSGAHIVRYALSNLTSWRGDTARAIKAELKELLK